MGNLVSLVLWAVNGIVNQNNNVKRKRRRRRTRRKKENLISSSSSMAANAKENLPPGATIDGGVVDNEQKDVKCRRGKKENLIFHSSYSSSSYYSPLANSKETIDGGVDKKKKDAVDQPLKKIVKRRRRNKGKKENIISSSPSTENAKEIPSLVKIYGASDSEHKAVVDEQKMRIINLRRSYSMENAKKNQQKKDAVDQPHKKIVERRTGKEGNLTSSSMEEIPALSKIYGSSDSEHKAVVDELMKRIVNFYEKKNQQKKDAVDQPHKKIRTGKEGNLTSSSSMENADENLALVTIDGGVDNQQKKDAVDLQHKKIVERRTGKEGNLTSSSSMVNPKKIPALANIYGADNKYKAVVDEQTNRIINCSRSSSSSSSSTENAKENLPLVTIDGGVDNQQKKDAVVLQHKKIVERRTRKEGNLTSSSSMVNPNKIPAVVYIYGASDSEYKAVVDEVTNRIINCTRSSSSSMENAKENLALVTIDGGVDNQQKKDAVDLQHNTVKRGRGKKGYLTSSSMVNAALVTTYGVDNEQKDAVDQPYKIVKRGRGKKGNPTSSSSSSMVNAKENPPLVTIYGGSDNEHKDVVDQPHKKIVEPRRGKEGNLISSSSSMANAKENPPLVMYGVYNELIDVVGQSQKIVKLYKYPTMTKVLGKFKLSVIGAQFVSSEVIVMQSKYNNTGKTTFLRLLAGLLKPDTVEGNTKMPQFNVSYMPPKINPVSRSTVRHMLQQRITDAYNDPYFVSNVMQPLLIEQLMDQQVVNLSYGECQRVELCLCLGKPADIYLIDEPTAYLDPELGMAAVKAIRGFIHHAKKTAFVIEPNLKRAIYISDRVIVFQGKPTIHCSADVPQFYFSHFTDEEWLIVEDGSYREYH